MRSMFSICIYYDINNVVKEEHCRGDKTIERKLGKVFAGFYLLYWLLLCSFFSASPKLFYY